MINQFSVFGLSKSFLLLRLFILREGLRKTPLISEENVRELIGSNIFFFILFSSRWNDDGYRGSGGLHGREGTNNKISFSLFNLFSIFSIFRSICFHQHERKSRKTFLLSETGKARDSPHSTMMWCEDTNQLLLGEAQEKCRDKSWESMRRIFINHLFTSSNEDEDEEIGTHSRTGWARVNLCLRLNYKYPQLQTNGALINWSNNFSSTFPDFLDESSKSVSGNRKFVGEKLRAMDTVHTVQLTDERVRQIDFSPVQTTRS